MTDHRPNVRRALLLLAAAVLLTSTGCSRDEAALVPSVDTGIGAGKSAAADTVGNYIVFYEGREFDGLQTTFTYQVDRLRYDGQTLETFFLELPECAPELASFTPPRAAIGVLDDPDVYGIRWTMGVRPHDPVGQQFRLVFAGEVETGVVRTVVSDFAGSSQGRVFGPCGGGAIRGLVFVDTDSSGAYDQATEGGLANVLVQALGQDGGIESALTDSTGAFELLLLEGAYTVRIDTTAHAGAFNGELGARWLATTPLERTVTIPPGEEGMDFGFRPSVETVIADLQQGELQSLGVPVKFWIAELMSALDPDEVPEGIDPEVLPYRVPVYTPQELLQFLSAIEGLALPEPYQFSDGEEIAEALQVLVHASGELLDVLLAELLATELNLVSGRGFEGQDGDLLAALALWGESVVVQAQDIEVAAGGTARGLRVDDLRYVIELFRTFNVGGGGGFDEK